ncbi:diaminopimelate epimerase [Lentilactobacillus farraginis]|uniref:Diaminopimelate epimerase n=1 Tax=Lentilactobacillus farraginis DSM 18382 = JCM 14108 TaxID=1423743 RepID=X0P9E5_9LACO|nr:diaminopimelate epimerase [Lentilactobacillus farraginis]KRM11085.1 diaminopimelate epimerase [Lentilactobacillus farraginis DSM 18382 = JCM 14108]GAF35619.1 diaminopimelate epimerase [Lentilactobacillus farraginis DSM 18382 = JCM 14108]
MAQLLKVHGSQNQFFILDQTELKTKLSQAELVALTKQITDPTKGLLDGADGVLVIDHTDHADALGSMQVINTDGSIASMCGNGLRTVSRYLADKYHQDAFKVETMDSDLAVHRETSLAPGVPTFSVEISPVTFNKESLPFKNLGGDTLVDRKVPAFAKDLTFTAIAVPNPHLISFVSEDVLHSDLLGRLGRSLNQPNNYFPDGVNVSFAQILDHNQLFVRTYERGVGFTNACGTGMSATSLAFCLNHPNEADFEETIAVYNPGGMVKTRVHDDDGSYHIDLIGNATFTHQIDLPEADLHVNNLTRAKISDTGEQIDYLNFVNNLKQQEV